MEILSWELYNIFALKYSFSAVNNCRRAQLESTTVGRGNHRGSTKVTSTDDKHGLCMCITEAELTKLSDQWSADYED